MFPLTRVPFWYLFFEPQPCGFLLSNPLRPEFIKPDLRSSGILVEGVSLEHQLPTQSKHAEPTPQKRGATGAVIILSTGKHCLMFPC